MPLRILSKIVDADESVVSSILEFLEYNGSIEKRVTKDFLSESEADLIQKIHSELSRRLTEDKIKSLTVYDLEKMLQSAQERKKIVD